MKQKALWILLFAVVLTGGVFFRVWRLNDRPMHTDEAVHADKFRALLMEGFYNYDPNEYHGPTLNYLSLISTCMRGETTYAQIDETTLRLVPAVFGILLLLTPLFFIDALGRRSVLLCMVLLAFSPAFVFYSRYYIQEMLLVCFTALFLGCLWRSIRSGKLGWYLLMGVFAGLMHATKETFIFSVIAAGAAFIACSARQQKSLKIRYGYLVGALCSAAAVTILFYSSFGTNWQGVIDSVATYGVWLKRAGGQSVHIHPWYYYLDLLTWLEFFEPITWNEDIIVALSAIGIFVAFTQCRVFINKPALSFWTTYTVILTIIYCLIPYKTPWCMLSFLFGMAVISGYVLDWFVGSLQTRWTKIIAGALVFVFLLASPIFQSWMLNFRYSSDPINPYVYAHTSTDVYAMVEAVEKIAVESENGKRIPIQVIAAGSDCWPLPWYLRAYTRVGYWSDVDPSAHKVPLILANARHEQELIDTLYSVPEPGQRNLYLPLFKDYVELRPAVEWRGYVRKDLWDRINSKKESVPMTQTQKENVWVSKPDKKQIKNLLKFSHRAMNANFEVFIQDSRGTYAGQAARAAFNEVDRLESLFSRFIDNSDVNRINALTPGQEAVVDEDTFQCLEIAQRAWQVTDGAFDVTIGNIITAWKNGDFQTASLQTDKPSMKMLVLDFDNMSVKVTNTKVSLDLGGVGKGYAVDRIAEVLKEWGIDRALIHGGASSIRALKGPSGKNGWPVTLTNPIDQKRIAQLQLENEVFSCSGLQGGEHIINPFTGQAVTDRRACWIRLKDDAAFADALTTAGMIMPLEKIHNLSDEVSGISLMLLMAPADTNDAGLLKIGNWPEH